METAADYRAVEELTREAFWGFTSPTCDEHYLVNTLRKSAAFVPELDFVVEVDGKLVGNVMYSKAKIVSEDGTENEVLTFGPLSVLPQYWCKGVGSALMRHSIAEAKRLGYRGIVFFGHPDYYPRFGFRNAKAFGITTHNGDNFDAFMAMPLYDGAFDNVCGKFYEDPLFNVNEEEAEAFNAQFPHKEPAYMRPIELMLERLHPAAREVFASRKIVHMAWLNRISGREMLKWDGIDENTLTIINDTLREYGYCEKLLPHSHILQLTEMDVRIPIVKKIREKDGISLYRVESEGERMVLKVFANADDRREIDNYKLLAELGVQMLTLLRHTECAILLPEVESSVDYRLGMEQDLSDADTAAAIAHWYKQLHQCGRNYLCTHSPQLYDESDCITQENMALIADKTNTCNNPFWQSLRDNFAAIRKAIDALPRTLTYNDFYWTNLVVAKDKSAAFMLDYNLMGKGIAYGDLRNVTSSLSEAAAAAFMREYGYYDIVEPIADAVISPLTTLYAACGREAFPNWAQSSLDELQSGALLENLHKWLKRS